MYWAVYLASSEASPTYPQRIPLMFIERSFSFMALAAVRDRHGQTFFHSWMTNKRVNGRRRQTCTSLTTGGIPSLNGYQKTPTLLNGSSNTSSQGHHSNCLKR